MADSEGRITPPADQAGFGRSRIVGAKRRGSESRRRLSFVCSRRGPETGSTHGPDVPAPSNHPPPHPANRNQRDLPDCEGLKDVGRAHQPKTNVVVTIVRMVVIAKRRARVVMIVVPRPAAQHTRLDPGTPCWGQPASLRVAKKIGPRCARPQGSATQGSAVQRFSVQRGWGPSTPTENQCRSHEGPEG